jgi:hypothetical protein
MGIFNQGIKGSSGIPTGTGFTYNDYKSEIDAGRPVLIHLTGHTMVGVGYYPDASQKIRVHDTWDYKTHDMTWGGTYANGPDLLQHWGVTVVKFEKATSVYRESKKYNLFKEFLHNKTKL